MLKTLRLLIPGAIIVLASLPIVYGTSKLGTIIEGNEKFLWVFVIGAGAAYYILDLRGRFMRAAVWEINDKIISTLLDPFTSHPVIGPARQKLAGGRKVMNIFYWFVDNDKSLTERAKSVYLNGLLLSSLPDLRAIALLFMVVYPIAYLLTENAGLWWLFAVAVFLHVLAVPMMAEVKKKHIELGEKQTAFILQFKHGELENQLVQAAKASVNMNAVHARLSRTIADVREALMRYPEPWVIGFSGGKDSSCVVKLIFNALIGLNSARGTVSVLHCDTGVEIPPVRNFVWHSLTGLAIEAKQHGLDLRCDVAVPKLRDRFFFKVIGRGYVPPTNKFRWCTDRLRINPVQSYIKRFPGMRKVVALGLRNGESRDRDQRINRHRTNDRNCLRQSGSCNTIIYSPILNYSVSEVWDVLTARLPPFSIDVQRLIELYQYTNGECPIIRDPKSNRVPVVGLDVGHVGVVRHDRAMEGLIDAGYTSLTPLLEFRNWLVKLRDGPKQRWSRRRNGALGPGPFTIAARRTILRRLLTVQKTVGFQLIGADEIEAIRAEWQVDQRFETQAA